MTKKTFFSFISPFIYLLPRGQVKALFMRQSKVRAGNMQQACDLVVNHLGCDICDTRKFVFYPKKYSQFQRLNLHISLYRLFIAFIIGVIMKFLLQQHLQLSSTCRQVATWTSRTEAVVYDCHQEEPALIQ